MSFGPVKTPVTTSTTFNGRVVYQYGKTLMYETIPYRAPISGSSGVAVGASGLVSGLVARMNDRLDNPTYYG